MATVKMVALAQFIASKVGATSITVTCDVDEYNVDSATVDNAFLTAQSMTHVRNGIYRYFFDGDDTRLYVATAKTSDSSVDQQHIPAVIVRLDRVNNADAKTSTRNAVAPLDSTATQAAAAAALAAYDPPTKAEMDAGLAGVTAPSAADVADAVWDEALAGHLAPGTTGAQLNAAGAAGDPLLNPVPGDYEPHTGGWALGRIGRGAISTVSPTSQSGDVEIDMGYDYANADGLALEWTDSDSSWVDLTGCTAVLIIAGLIEVDCAILNEGTATQSIRCELTATQTGLLKPGRRAFVVDVTRGGRLIKQISGTVTITAKVTA